FIARGGADTTNRKIFRAAVTVILAGLLARAALGGKELVIAQWFGRSDALDAFLIAYLLPSFVMNLLTGALASSLVPVLVETREKEGREAGDRLVSNVAFFTLLALAAMALLLTLLAPFYLPWLGSSFSPQKLRLTRELLYVLLPWIVLSGVAAVASSVLNAGEKFALPAVVPAITPLVTIFFIALAARQFGPFVLAAGAAAGSVLEAAVLVYFLRAQGTAFNFRWSGLDANLRSVLRQYTPMLAGAFLMGSATVVDQAMASMLGTGSVATLSYGSKIVNMFVLTAATALSTAVLPYFSKMAAASDWQGCRHTLKRYSLLVISAAVPFTLLLMLLSRPLVKLIFERGAFTPADTALVSSVQIFYSIQVPFFVWGMLFVRFLSSIRRNDLLMYGGAINLVVDVVLNLVLMRFMGVAGIALSTSLVYLVSCIFVGFFALRSLTTASAVAVPALAGGDSST
ncbi:MAG TPA: lipid II flippase MurJ, partial [Terriglobales bacterium]|nr:lipid II flippase MurJ [Terriglobales bacterium]